MENLTTFTSELTLINEIDKIYFYEGSSERNSNCLQVGENLERGMELVRIEKNEYKTGYFRTIFTWSNGLNIWKEFDSKDYIQKEAEKRLSKYLHLLSRWDQIITPTGRFNFPEEKYGFRILDGNIIRIGLVAMHNNDNSKATYRVYKSFFEACCWYGRYHGTVEYRCPTEMEVKQDFEKALNLYIRDRKNELSEREKKACKIFLNNEYIEMY